MRFLVLGALTLTLSALHFNTTRACSPPIRGPANRFAHPSATRMGDHPGLSGTPQPSNRTSANVSSPSQKYQYLCKLHNYQGILGTDEHILLQALMNKMINLVKKTQYEATEILQQMELARNSPEEDKLENNKKLMKFLQRVA